MAAFASLTPPDASRPGRQQPACPADARGPRERRSPLRPRFREGWRKRVPQHWGDAQPLADTATAAPIYVWASRVSTLLAVAANLDLLDEDDRASLRTLRDGAAKDSAVAARILLRLSLSALTQRRVTPQDWRFARSNSGKPFIKDNRQGIDFSVSHVDAVVMVAVGQGVDVGIDVETVDQEFEERVVEHFCHASERQVLDTLPDAQRRRAFLELWTEKEAYTKMLGVGHSLDFQSVCVGNLQMVEDESARLCVEDFYFSIDHSLYHAALAVDRRTNHQPIEIALINAGSPGEAPFTASPAAL